MDLRFQRRGLLQATVATILAAWMVIGLSACGGGPSINSDTNIGEHAHVLGRADAPVTVVVFADFQCPFCADYSMTLERRLKTELVESGKVRYAYRHLAFLGQESVQAAEASECAAEQGKFWEYHDTVFMNWAGENKGAFSDANLKGFARKLGLKPTDFDTCLDSNKYEKQVTDEREAARAKNVRSTPSLLINGKLYAGAPRDFETLKAYIEVASEG